MASSTFAIAAGVLARAARVDVSHADIVQACAACAVRSYAEKSWSRDLARVGDALGLRARSVAVSTAALARGDADDLFPIVRLVASEGAVQCVTVVSRRRRKLRVRIDDEPALRWLDAEALAGIVDADATSPTEWVTADPVSSGSRLLSLVRLERDDVGVVVIYAAGVGLLSLATPLGVQFLVNTVAFGALLQPLVVLTLLVLGGLTLESLLRALQAWVIERIQQRIFVRVALDVAHRIPRVEQSSLDGHHPPELVNRFFDVVTLQKGAAELLSEGVSIVLSALVGMSILAFYHPFLLAFDVALIAGLALVVFVLGRRGVATSIDESAAKYAVAAWLEDAAVHRNTLALGDGARYVVERAESLTRDWLEQRRRHFSVVFRQSTGALALRAVASAALLGLGGWLVLSRQLTLGQLVAAELVVSSVVAGFAKLGKAFESFYDLVTAAEKVGHLVELDVVHDHGSELASTPRPLDVALSGEIDLHLVPGSRTVIHGAAGAGKSTLADVLAAVREPCNGRVTVDGAPAGDLSITSWRSAVALIRDAEIFDGTLFDNVAMGRPDVDRRAVRAVLAAVGLDPYVSTLPAGLDTPMTSMKAGTAALLVTIARALAGSARLCIVDCALDRLEDRDRQVVWRALSERPWTLLLTTTRPELLELSEHAFAMDRGRVTRAGQGSVRLWQAEEA